MSELNTPETIVVGCLAFVAMVAVAIGIHALLACALCWAVDKIWHYQIPFWPTVALLFVVSAVFGGIKSNSN